MSIHTLIYLSLAMFILYLMFTIGFPFLLAFITALILEPIIQIFTRIFKGKRIYSSLLVCSCSTFLFLSSSYLVVIKGVREGILLSKSIISFIKENYQEFTNFTGKAKPFIQSFTEETHLEITDFAQTGVASINSLLGRISESLFGTVTGIPSLTVELLIFIMALFLFSFSLPTLKKEIMVFFDRDSHHKIEVVMHKLYQAVLGFIRAQIIISFFIFLFTLAGLLVLDIRYALVIAIIITIVDILPVFGTGTIIIPLSIFYLIKQDFFVGIGSLILYSLLVILRRIIEPKILGDAIGISALAALASMYIGFKLTGLVGLFFGPVTIIFVKALIHADILKINIKF